MKIRSFLLCLCITSYSIVRSQNQGNQWYFGKNAGIMFDDTGIAILSDGKINTFEGCSSISDKNGNLLLYSDGNYVWNKYHKVVKNGYGLLGHFSSTQSVLIINHPDNDSLYYIITTPFAYNYKVGMRYSVLNINSNRDSGVVLDKNIFLSTNSTEKLNAVNHANNRDIWIVGHQYGNNTLFGHLLTKNGFIDCTVFSNAGESLTSNPPEAQGNMKFSHDGRWLVNTYIYDNLSDYFELFSFDNTKGSIISHHLFPDYALPYGAEFSPNLKYLYITGDDDLIQINLNDLSINEILKIPVGRSCNSLQIGKDRKIYCARNDSMFLGVINSPDSLGLKCNFKPKGLFLNGRQSQFGLPNFNQSYFYTPAINYSYEMECIGNSIKFWGYDTFSASVHQWEVRKLGIGSWQSISSSKNFTYTFTDTGRYEVRYIASNGTRQDTVSKTITLYSKIDKHFLGKDTVYASGGSFIKTLNAPYGMHCQLWQDNSGLSTYTADTAGVYICKVTNKAFCEVTDTIVISECINNLTVPSIYRSKDTLYTYQQLADSFVWYRNNVQYKITKEAFIKLSDTGTYRVEAAKKGHCNRSSTVASVTKLGVQRLSIQDFNIRVYPNPSSEIVFIQSEKEYKLVVTDIAGKTILETESSQLSLPKGVYFFRFNIEGTVVTEKVLVL